LAGVGGKKETETDEWADVWMKGKFAWDKRNAAACSRLTRSCYAIARIWKPGRADALARG